MPRGGGEERDAAIRWLNEELAVDERAVGVGGRGEVGVRVAARLGEIDADRFVRPPPLPHQRDNVAGRVVGFVAAQRGVVEGFGGSERTPSAVEAAAHENDAEVGLREEVRGEELAGGGGRPNLPEARRDRVIHLGGCDHLPRAGSTHQQHSSVVGQP